MADHHILYFQNNHGYKTIEIGVKEFMCIGATQPFDHPHIFIDMGAADEKICPYCSTLYRYNHSLPHRKTNPDGCLYNADNTL
ncbi:zinc-finger domain-containing protein [Bartonella sp. F02]|uniref:zinc-finger domain-containing protein n=1 Tax=Bartonella sp. F02 TaxID=2967262 RepID=UPI0022A92636|nr:zinc-finger domain-containing protein [Bartonella sp. F02]MCZ2328181.1 zinc-finger domain-containing protein [Bartonella sp. F02]